MIRDIQTIRYLMEMKLRKVLKLHINIIVDTIKIITFPSLTRCALSVNAMVIFLEIVLFIGTLVTIIMVIRKV